MLSECPYSVTYLQRRPRSSGNYSIEAIFEDLRTRLNDAIRYDVHTMPYQSDGLWRRLMIAVSAWKNQGQVNHVTGDINFAALATSGRRTVLTIHDCGDLLKRHDWKSLVLRKIWVQWPVQHVARVTTVSHAAKADIVALSGCDPDKVVVIPNAISDAFAARPQSFNVKRPRILQVGTSINKNLSRLIAAVQGLDCTLVIVGRLSDDIQQQLTDSGVEFENPVNLSEEALVAQYEQADLVAFASTFEGFGMPIVEAQTVGRPVVTSNISSMPEVAGDGACLVDPFDIESIRSGIVSVIGDADYRRSLVEQGYQNARRFNADGIARQYQAVYESVIANL